MVPMSTVYPLLWYKLLVGQNVGDVNSKGELNFGVSQIGNY